MTQMKTSSTSDLSTSLELVEVTSKLKFSKAALMRILPDVETALFFSKVYELNAEQVARLLSVLFQCSLTEALTGADHSMDLQDYLVDLAAHMDDVDSDDITTSPAVPHGDILPEVWKSLEVTVAQSIKDVAAKLGNTVALMPGKQGHMVFKSMMQLNKKRPTMGDHRAQIVHARQLQNLLILDVSGSMSSSTVRAIVNDVVALSYQANAHMAIVSDTCTHWEPGTYDVDAVLRHAEYSGTHYETLAPLFQGRDWGTVITIADYDSSLSAKQYLAAHMTGSIDTVLDISLVTRPTYLAECVGQKAREVRPILISNTGDLYTVLR